MSLINLSLLRTLHSEAVINKNTALRLMLSPRLDDQKMSEGLLTQLLKTHAQAKVIYKNLKRLHRVCQDFAEGNFQPYKDRHDHYEARHVVNPEYRTAYEPLGELDRVFNQAFDFPLPRRIEQYGDLLNLCHSFSHVWELKRAGLNRFYGQEPIWYEVINSEGQREVLPPSELPPAYVRQQVEAEQLRSAQVERSLDHYNLFYEQSTHLILEALEDRNVQNCAKEILRLFSPETK